MLALREAVSVAPGKAGTWSWVSHVTLAATHFQGWGDEHSIATRLGPKRLLEELCHIQTGNHDLLEDGHIVGVCLRWALLQRLDDGLLHVPAGIPSHGQERANVLIPAGGREHQGVSGAAATAAHPPRLTQTPPQCSPGLAQPTLRPQSRVNSCR